MYYILYTVGASEHLGKIELLSLIISSICHDIDHPGLSNNFQEKIQSRVARLHRKSTLENHHLANCKIHFIKF